MCVLYLLRNVTNYYSMQELLILDIQDTKTQVNTYYVATLSIWNMFPLKFRIDLEKKRLAYTHKQKPKDDANNKKEEGKAEEDKTPVFDESEITLLEFEKEKEEVGPSEITI